MTDCPAPGCARQVPTSRYACPRHWYALPAHLRTAIARAWGRRLKGVPGAMLEHQQAKDAAQAFLDGLAQP